MPPVLVTFAAEAEVRSALSSGLGPAGSPVFLEDTSDRGRYAVLEGANAVIAWNPTRELRAGELERLGHVRLLQLVSAGANHLPFDRIPESVTIASNVGAFAEPMAEHVLAMALALAKRLPQKHAELAAGGFHQRPPTRMFEGLVCGILGFGAIGKATARRMRPLGIRIRAVNTSGATDEEVEFAGTLADLPAVLAASDIVVVALPLTKATDGLIGARELALMKPDAILINVARAAIVQERALYEHLVANPEFTAGIDAWWVEPFSDGEFRTDFPFLELSNVLGSPHNSAIVPGIIEHAAGMAAENVAAFLRGERVRGLVRREDYA
jgi:phosphoglycerate dehydrogenase-like enzyme